MIEMFITPKQVRTSNFYTSVFIRTCNTPWCWRRVSEWFAKKQTACRSRHEPLNSKNLQRETRPAPLVKLESWKYSSQLQQNNCHWRITHPIVQSFVLYLTTLSVFSHLSALIWQLYYLLPPVNSSINPFSPISPLIPSSQVSLGLPCFLLPSGRHFITMNTVYNK